MLQNKYKAQFTIRLFIQICRGKFKRIIRTHIYEKMSKKGFTKLKSKKSSFAKLKNEKRSFAKLFFPEKGKRACALNPHLPPPHLLLAHFHNTDNRILCNLHNQVHIPVC